MELTEILKINALSLDLPETFGQVDNWRILTNDWSRYSLYASEPYLRESIADADSVLGEYLPAFTKQFASILIKPDAIIGQRVSLICDYLRDHGFQIVQARPFQFDRLMVRELWRYSMNISTNEKFELVDSIHSASQSVYLLLEDLAPDGISTSATVRLQHLKGSAFASDRRSDSIRSVAGSPNEILVLVHAPDEPLEMLRELGLLFDRSERQVLYAASRETITSGLADSSEQISSTISSINAAPETNELNLEISMERLKKQFNVNDRLATAKTVWPKVKGLISQRDDLQARWDSIVIGTAVIDLSIDGMRKLIE